MSSAASSKDVGVADHFATLNQQHEAATLGMWVFLATEIMFFGTMIASYTMYRITYPQGFQAASLLMDKTIGTVNTAILLTSSLLVALAVRFAHAGEGRKIALCTALTALLGVVFDGLKFYEYGTHIADHLLPGVDFHYSGPFPRATRLFFVLYYVMTGVHALHVAIGVVIFLILTVQFLRSSKLTPRRRIILANCGLYWHFVDIVWIFLYPFFYLVGRGS